MKMGLFRQVACSYSLQPTASMTHDQINEGHLRRGCKWGSHIGQHLCSAGSGLLYSLCLQPQVLTLIAELNHLLLKLAGGTL